MSHDRRIAGEDTDLGDRTPWLEWAASGIGLLLTLGVFGFIGWQVLGDATSPPVITVETTGVAPVADGYRVMFQARNIGGAAASKVRIEGTLSAGGTAETSSVVLDYIPGQSEREGGLFFTQAPQSGSLSVRATGYAKP